MITELTVRNFKNISDQTYKFTDFDLLVGRNNSGKSTILQAMAIWQYCIDEFHRMKTRSTGKNGVQIVLPNFTALPLPEFNLIWKNKIDRKYKTESKSQEYILIDIIIKYKKNNGEIGEFGISLRYQTPQSIYAIPQKGWSEFKKLDAVNELPRIVYVPPFSGLDPFEQWVDDSVLRQYVGKGQPGSVLRNLLFRVIDQYIEIDGKQERIKTVENKKWKSIQDKVLEWFNVKLLAPEYEKGGSSTYIEVKYEKDKKDFDIISGGSGFHQTLTLLAFYYGYPGITTILFDEPDAHMHVNLQREILSYFHPLKTTQFIIATHAEEFIKGVSPESIISILNAKPERVQSNPEIITALSEVDNMSIVNTQQEPYILYVEGEDDERIINGWASVLNKQKLLGKFYIATMGGGNKKGMSENADRHFKGLRKIVPDVKRLVLFDYDLEESYHPKPKDSALFEWKRKNIENYLLVPDVWKRAVLWQIDLMNNQVMRPILDVIDGFFSDQNIALPKGKTWRNVDANFLAEVNGKKILFENADSLFQKISKSCDLKINRETLSKAFKEEEIHQDVIDFFAKLEDLTKPA